jgi:hypothetical protein
MKKIAPVLVAALIIGSAATSYAKSPKSFFNQVIKSAQDKVNTALPARQAGGGKHFGGGGHLPGGPGIVLPPTGPGYPGPGRGGSYCPPPPPRVCYVYFVYYYDCHFGWKTYGSFNRYSEAQFAMQRLQSQGYRTYLKKVAR